MGWTVQLGFPVVGLSLPPGANQGGLLQKDVKQPYNIWYLVEYAYLVKVAGNGEQASSTLGRTLTETSGKLAVKSRQTSVAFGLLDLYDSMGSFCCTSLSTPGRPQPSSGLR